MASMWSPYASAISSEERIPFEGPVLGVELEAPPEARQGRRLVVRGDQVVPQRGAVVRHLSRLLDQLLIGQAHVEPRGPPARPGRLDGLVLHARRNPPYPGHTHGSCSNCPEYAADWRADLLDRIGGCTWTGAQAA
jgi:hypothetical protein